MLGLRFFICKIKVVEGKKKGKEVGREEKRQGGRQAGSWLVSIWWAATLRHFLESITDDPVFYHLKIL